MYGEATIAADVLLTAPTAFAVPAGGSLRFVVEEEEMWVELGFQGTVSHSVAEGKIDATFFVDTVDVADLADGLVRYTASTVATDEVGVYFVKKLRLAQGEHLLEVRFKTGAGNIQVEGASHAAKLWALRHSHNATVAANQNSKQAGGIY